MERGRKICRTLSLIAAFLAITLSLTAILSWASALFWSSPLKNFSLFIPPAIAIGIFFSSLACLFLWKGQKEAWGFLGHFFGYLTLALGLLLLISDFFNWKFQIDFSFSKVSYASALAMVFYSLALIFPYRSRCALCSQVLLLFAALVGIGYFVGHIFGASVFALFSESTTMTPLAALCWTLLPTAALLSRPNFGITGLFLSPSLGGKTLRILLPIGFVLPLLLGYIILKGQFLFNFPTHMSIELLSFANTFLFFLAVWGCAHFIEKIDVETKRKSKVMSSQYTFLKIISEGCSREEGLAKLLQEACRRLDMNVGELWLYNTEDDALHLATTAYSGLDKMPDFDPTTTLTTFKPGGGLPGVTFRKLAPMWIEDASNSPFFVRIEMAQRYGLKGAIGIPLISNGEPIGVISAFSKHPMHETSKKNCSELIDLISVPIAQYVRQQQEKEGLRQNEKELRLKSEALYLSNVELEQFATLASHDLLEPVRKNVTFVDLILQKNIEGLDEEAKDYLKRLSSSSTRMQNLIESLLEYSKAGQKAMSTDQVDLNDLVKEIIIDQEAKIRELNAKIKADVLPQIEGDKTLLLRVFQNLIGNSLKFHKKNVAPDIQMWSNQSNGLVTLYVKDNGIGFSEEDSARIFRPFQKLHARTEYDGVGIGLTICKKIIERHGGTIKVESSPKEGTLFTLEIPESQPSSTRVKYE